MAATSSLIEPTGAGKQSLAHTQFCGQAALGGNMKLWRYTSVSVVAGATSSLDIDSTAGAGDWNWNAVKIHQIIVQASASVDFDILLYGEDGFTTNEHYYLNENNNLVMNDKPLGGLFYIDRDSSRELHLQIINTDAVNASTFDVFLIISPIE